MSKRCRSTRAGDLLNTADSSLSRLPEPLWRKLSFTEVESCWDRVMHPPDRHRLQISHTTTLCMPSGEKPPQDSNSRETRPEPDDPTPVRKLTALLHFSKSVRLDVTYSSFEHHWAARYTTTSVTVQQSLVRLKRNLFMSTGQPLPTEKDVTHGHLSWQAHLEVENYFHITRAHLIPQT